MKRLLIIVSFFCFFFLSGCSENVLGLDLSNLNISFENQEDTIKRVTGNLVLPEQFNDLEITWSSSNKEIISDSGVVLVPEREEDLTVMLIATVQYSGVAVSKKFILTIKANKEEQSNIGDVNLPSTDGKEFLALDIIASGSSILKEGENIQLSVLISYAVTKNNVTRTETEECLGKVIWISSNEGVATVDSEGLLTAQAAGSTMVAAVVNGKFTSLDVRVVVDNGLVITERPVITIEAPLFMSKGTSEDMKVFIDGAEITGATFTSSNDSIIEVSSAGVLSALSAGIAEISILVETDAEPLVSTYTIFVVEHQDGDVFQLDEINISGKKEVFEGFQILLAATVSPSDVVTSFTYSSSDENIATVKNNGWVTGVSAGVVMITATCVDNPEYKADYKVTVIPVAKSIVISGSKTVSYGQNIILTVQASPLGANDSVSWLSSNTTIATVDNAGRVTGLKAGVAVITATALLDSSVKATFNVTVTDEMFITLNPTSVSLNVGSTKTIGAFVTAASLADKTIKWSSSSLNIVTVSSDGVVTAKAIGTATIVAKLNADNSVQAQVAVTVTAAPKPKITISASTASLQIGATKTLTATVSGATDTAVLWSTSNSAVATVSKGLVSAKAAGTTTITASASADSTVKATCVITVSAPIGGALIVKQNITGSIKIGETKYQILINDSSGNAISRLECTFVSANSSVATVSAYGTISALKAGTAKITVTHPTKGTGTIILTITGTTPPPVNPPSTEKSLGVFNITAYCPCKICCGIYAGGPTWSGVMPTAGRTIAVDSTVIAMGSKVKIKGHIYTAEDKGGHIKGKRIDIYFKTHQEALNWGRQNIEVFLIK